MNSSKPIREACKALNINKSQLARLTGYSRSAISSYESGSRKPSRRFLEKLEEVRKAAETRVRLGARGDLLEPKALKRRLAALEARVGAFESRSAALETRSAQLEARAEAALPTAVGGPGVAVRRAIQVGGQDQAATEKQPDEKTAEKKARRQEH